MEFNQILTWLGIENAHPLIVMGGVSATVLVIVLLILFIYQALKKKPEIIQVTRPTVPTYTPDFIRWVKNNFKSWGEYHTFYRKVILPYEEKLEKEMWP